MSMGFFNFTIHTCPCQAASGPVPWATVPRVPPTRPAGHAVKLPKKGAAAKVSGTFFHVMLSYFFIDFCIFRLVNMSPD